jgi:uncharacterized membrane protein YfcA
MVWQYIKDVARGRAQWWPLVCAAVEGTFLCTAFFQYLSGNVAEATYFAALACYWALLAITARQYKAQRESEAQQPDFPTEYGGQFTPFVAHFDPEHAVRNSGE